MLKGLIFVAVVAALYSLYLEIQRGRAYWRLVGWLKEERSAEWESAHSSGRQSNIEDSVTRLRRGRLSDDADFLGRHDAATRRGRRLAIALVVAGVAILLVAAGTTLFDWSL